MSSAKVTIVGNLGRDPETRINANNTFIANFSIAVNQKRTSATGEEIKKTDWYNITATGKQAKNTPAKATACLLKESRLSTPGKTAMATPASMLTC